MKNINFTRLWKGSEHRQSRSETDQAEHSADRAGIQELRDMEIANVSGGVTDGCIPRPGKPGGLL
jgi:hypothetical protein